MHIKQLDYPNSTLTCQSELELSERYYRYRLIQDYVSGMTGIFACVEYRGLMAEDFV